MANLNLSSFPQLVAVDRTSYIPYYAQVKEALKELLESRLLAPKDQLPGEVELCQAFDVSRTVIRQALDELEYGALIVRGAGQGYLYRRAQDLWRLGATADRLVPGYGSPRIRPGQQGPQARAGACQPRGGHQPASRDRCAGDRDHPPAIRAG